MDISERSFFLFGFLGNPKLFAFTLNFIGDNLNCTEKVLSRETSKETEREKKLR